LRAAMLVDSGPGRHQELGVVDVPSGVISSSSACSECANSESGSHCYPSRAPPGIKIVRFCTFECYHPEKPRAVEQPSSSQTEPSSRSFRATTLRYVHHHSEQRPDGASDCAQEGVYLWPLRAQSQSSSAARHSHARPIPMAHLSVIANPLRTEMPVGVCLQQLLHDPEALGGSTGAMQR
jgi:hypothetical protein